MDVVMRIPETLKSFRETRLSALRPVSEFFDHHRLSRPADFNTASSRISYNTRYFSGNYSLIVLVLAVYALITNSLLLISLGFLFGGFIVIKRYASESMQIAGVEVTQRSLYIGLFVVGLPLLIWSSPLGTFFWLVGASLFVILAHAALIEPGVESEYADLETGGG